MKRRSFIKNAAMAVAAMSVAPAAMSAAEKPYTPAIEGKEDGSDFQIVSDTTKDGVRYVTATPSEIVCSNKIEIEIEVATGTIKACKFTRGCPGNALGLCKIIKGMKADEVAAKLIGTPCGKRGTSCPDQLARVLSAIK